jgi:conjugal transfer mating pair stabilization protein TraG
MNVCSHSCNSAIRSSQAPLRPNSDIKVVLPESGDGFATYNREPDGVDQVGTQKTIDFLVDLGQSWAKVDTVPFQVGDISRAGGGPFPPHKAHQSGKEADIRPFRKDGHMEPCDINNPEYNSDETRKFVELVRSKEPQVVVFFNDPVLIAAGLTQFLKGHDNHLHIKLPGGSALDQNSNGC